MATYQIISMFCLTSDWIDSISFKWSEEADYFQLHKKLVNLKQACTVTVQLAQTVPILIMKKKFRGIYCANQKKISEISDKLNVFLAGVSRRTRQNIGQ